MANFENFEVYQQLHLQAEFFHSPEVHEAGCLLRVRPRCVCTLPDAWDESAVYKSGLELCRLRPTVQMWWTIVAPQILEPFYDLSNKFVKIKLAFFSRTISKSGNTVGIRLTDFRLPETSSQRTFSCPVTECRSCNLAIQLPDKMSGNRTIDVY